MFAEPTVVVELGMVLDCGGTCLLIKRGKEGRKDLGVEVEVEVCQPCLFRFEITDEKDIG